MQPLQSSALLCKCTGTSSSATMSEITARPPLRRTRKISANNCRLDFDSTKLRTQLETTTSTESVATNGCVMRSSSANSSAARKAAAFHVTRRIAAAVILFDHFSGNDFEVAPVVFDRTAKRSFGRFGRGGVTLL